MLLLILETVVKSGCSYQVFCILSDIISMAVFSFLSKLGMQFYTNILILIYGNETWMNIKKDDNTNSRTEVFKKINGLLKKRSNKEWHTRN